MADPFIAPVQSNAPGISGVGAVINGQDPNYLYSVMQASRNKMLADALTQQGMAGIDYDHAGAVSPLQGLAKLVQAYAGASGAANANHSLADLQSQANQRMALAYGINGGQPQAQDPASAAMGQGAAQQPSLPGADGEMVNQGGVGPTTANAARLAQVLQAPATTPQATSSGSWGTPGQPSALNPAGAPPMLVMSAAMGDPAAKSMLEQWLKNNAPTDSQKNWTAQGVDPRLLAPGTIAESNAKGKTPEIQNAQYMGKTPAQMLAASLGADAKGAEITREPNKLFVNSVTGDAGIVPALPPGVNAQGVNPHTGAVASVSPVQGANTAIAATEAAKIGETMATRVKEDGTIEQGTVADLFPTATQQGGVLQQGNGAPTPAQMAIIQKDAAANGITPVVNWQQPSSRMPRAVSTGPAPGTVERAKEGATAAVEGMKTTQADLNAVRQAAPAMTSEIDRMLQIGANGNWAVGSQGTGAMKLFSSNAAEYEKARDNIVSQLSSGGMATDSARQMVYGAIPGYEAPKEAKIAGLQTLRNQIATKALKGDYLSDAYNRGDATAHTANSAAFDKNVVPAMTPVITMPSGPQRAAALKAIIQANPGMKSHFDWAITNGLMK